MVPVRVPDHSDDPVEEGGALLLFGRPEPGQKDLLPLGVEGELGLVVPLCRPVAQVLPALGGVFPDQGDGFAGVVHAETAPQQVRQGVQVPARGEAGFVGQHLGCLLVEARQGVKAIAVENDFSGFHVLHHLSMHRGRSSVSVIIIELSDL